MALVVCYGGDIMWPFCEIMECIAKGTRRQLALDVHVHLGLSRWYSTSAGSNGGGELLQWESWLLCWYMCVYPYHLGTQWTIPDLASTSRQLWAAWQHLSPMKMSMRRFSSSPPHGGGSSLVWLHALTSLGGKGCLCHQHASKCFWNRCGEWQAPVRHFS